MKEKILLVIPAYNEEQNILLTYQTIVEYNKKNKTNYDVIVINDGSTDNTELVLNDNNIPHIKLVSNLGIGGAVQTGYKYARINDYDIAIQFDGDGQHDINFVDKLIEPIIKNNADMVIGSRFVNKNQNGFKSSAMRRIGIKIISFFIRLKTNKIIFDTTSGCRAINKKLIKRFSNVYPLEYPEPISTTEVLMSGYKVNEVSVEMKERKSGKSSIRFHKNIYYMINVILNIIFAKKGDRDE